MALFVSGAATLVPARAAPLTRRDMLAGTAAGVLAAGAPRLATAAPKYGGTINMHSYSFPPPNWHPHVTNTVQVMSYSGIYNQLIEYNPETEDPFDLRGDLATSWDLSKDGKVYTFHLNPKATWHDGKPVTAEDVVYSMDSMVDTDAKPPRVVTLPALEPYYEKGTARAIDPHTVEIPLKIPFAPDFLPTLASDFCKIIPKHLGRVRHRCPEMGKRGGLRALQARQVCEGRLDRAGEKQGLLEAGAAPHR
jgi:peptide/nickel transport system substrate-binding protein